MKFDIMDFWHKTMDVEKTTSFLNYSPSNQFDYMPTGDTATLPMPFSAYSWEEIFFVDRLLHEDQTTVDLARMKSSLNGLKKEIGEILFNRLSYDDKCFMIQTAGVIDFGGKIDLEQVATKIKEYDDQ